MYKMNAESSNSSPLTQQFVELKRIITSEVSWASFAYQQEAMPAH